MFQMKLAGALAATGITWATLTGCQPGDTTMQPTPEPGPAPAAVSMEPWRAQYTPSSWPLWNDAISAGLDYWQGRDGFTAPVTIKRTTTNYCGEGAAGCALPKLDGTCEIWIKRSYDNSRWAMIAIGLHEVGHCVGHGHDDTDLVMHG